GSSDRDVAAHVPGGGAGGGYLSAVEQSADGRAAAGDPTPAGAGVDREGRESVRVGGFREGGRSARRDERSAGGGGGGDLAVFRAAHELHAVAVVAGAAIGGEGGGDFVADAGAGALAVEAASSGRRAHDRRVHGVVGNGHQGKSGGCVLVAGSLAAQPAVAAVGERQVGARG